MYWLDIYNSKIMAKNYFGNTSILSQSKMNMSKIFSYIGNDHTNNDRMTKLSEKLNKINVTIH